MWFYCVYTTVIEQFAVLYVVVVGPTRERECLITNRNETFSCVLCGGVPTYMSVKQNKKPFPSKELRAGACCEKGTAFPFQQIKWCETVKKNIILK